MAELCLENATEGVQYGQIPQLKTAWTATTLPTTAPTVHSNTTNTTTTPLQSITASALNVAQGLNSASQKRKFDSSSDETGLGGPLTLLASEGESDVPLRLFPRLLIPRSSLPLASLALESSASGRAPSRLFHAHLPLLESQAQDAAGDATILIMQEDGNGSLHAVERVRNGLYVLCRLQHWVALEDFKRQRVKIQRRRCLETSIKTESSVWWKKENSSIHKVTFHPTSLPKIRLSMQLPPTEPQQTLHHSMIPTKPSSNDQTSPKRIDYPSPTNPESRPVQDDYSTLMHQYLEALYVSKTSLAYFTKGPLSRARATYQHLKSTTTPDLDLPNFLRTFIMSALVNENKYKTTLPELIVEVPVGITIEDGESFGQLTPAIRKSRKRKKLSKGGLIPAEEEYLVKWWIRRENSESIGGPNDTMDQRVRRALVDQRTRETQLQIILILEVLALEASSLQNSNMGEEETDMVENGKDLQATPGKKPRKPQDLSLLLDVLVDKLCIWQTMHQEDGKATADHLLSSESAGQVRGKSSSDILADFHAEVVIPFYAARLPDLCSSIRRKLGVAGGPSPVRPSVKRTLSGSDPLPRKTDAARKKQPPKVRKTLERVLTDEHVKNRRSAGSMMRSATDSALIGMKRELGEISLSSIPTDRPRLQDDRRYAQREVDLAAVARSTEDKLQRKMAIEKETRDAIAAVKKPNRDMALKEVIESAEQRKAGSISRPRKSKHPVHNPRAQGALGVQVIATPKGNRHRDFLHGDSQGCRTQIHEQVMEEQITVLPTSALRVPTSLTRSMSVSTMEMHRELKSALTGGTELGRTPALPTMQNTPTRRSKQPRQSLLRSFSLGHPWQEGEDELCQASPELPLLKPEQQIVKQPSAPFQTSSFEDQEDTPSKPRPQSLGLGDRGFSTAVHETPIKRHATRPMQTPPATVPDSKGGGGSIYESLGWDDVDDLI